MRSSQPQGGSRGQWRDFRAPPRTRAGERVSNREHQQPEGGENAEALETFGGTSGSLLGAPATGLYLGGVRPDASRSPAKYRLAGQCLDTPSPHHHQHHHHHHYPGPAEAERPGRLSHTPWLFPLAAASAPARGPGLR